MRTFLGTLSLVLGFAAYLPYFAAMRKHTVKPHVFSWITWGMIGGLAFILSFSGRGGAGAWIFALQSIFCFGIAGYALIRGEKNITRLDRIAFVAALAAAIFYIWTKNAPASVLLISAINLLAYVPTFRKSYSKPFEEPALTYFFSFSGFAFSIGALESHTFVTMFYPLTLMVLNIVFIVFLLIRRRVFSAG